MNSKTDFRVRPAGWQHHSRQPVQRPLDFVTQIAVPTDGQPWMLHFIFTDDGLYVPAIVRTPEGGGPFPLVICLHGGSGGLGVSYLVYELQERGWIYDQLLAEGYAIAYTEGRMEIEWAYGTEMEPLLDHQDIVTIYHYFESHPLFDPTRIGFFGVSHGGELQMKLISEIGFGPAALVAGEPAAVEFLSLWHEGPRTERTMQYNFDLPDSLCDLAAVQSRLERISEEVPILILGRDDDHLQGIFRKLHELLQRAGKNVHWTSWDHPEHAYQYGPQRTPEGYAPDAIQQETLATILAFLNQYVRDREKNDH